MLIKKEYLTMEELKSSVVFLNSVTKLFLWKAAKIRPNIFVLRDTFL